MRHISLKLVILTCSLSVGLLLLTSYFSYTLLKKESQAYSFQSQLLQTQLFSANLETTFSRILEVAGRFSVAGSSPERSDYLVNLLRSAKSADPLILGIGIYFNGQNPHWTDYPDHVFDGLNLPLEKLASSLVIPLSGSHHEMVLLYPKNDTVVGIKVILEGMAQECSGLNLAVFNQLGNLVFSCNPELPDLFKKEAGILKEVLSQRLHSGAFERGTSSNRSIWTFSDADKVGRVISVSSGKAVYRPAFTMGMRIGLLILMSIGIAIVVSILGARLVTGPIQAVTLATQRIADGDFDTRIEVNTKDETRVLADAVERMAERIRNLILTEVEKTKLESQLEVAGTLQRLLIPPKEVRSGSFLMNSLYHPADQCGGDWWGFVDGKEKLIFLIGDVTGHGYGSALMVATTRGFLSTLQEQVDCPNPNLNPAEILGSLNRVVYDAARGELNMTAMCMVIDRTTGKFELANAGHYPAYQISPGSPKPVSVTTDGNRLGETRVLEILPGTVSGVIKPGEKVVFYTDGIQELGPPEKPIGRKGFYKFLGQRQAYSGAKLASDVETVLYPMQNGRSLVDDITFVVLEADA